MSSAYLWIKAFHIVFVASWVLGVIGAPPVCRVLWRGFERSVNRRSHRRFRVFNEASVLVVVKPF